MSDPTLKSGTPQPPRSVEQIIALRIQGRQALGSMLAEISRWEGASRGLDEMGFGADGAKLRGHLQECYGIVGNLLGALAPWKDPQGMPDGLLIPDEPELEEELMEEGVAGV